MSRSCSFAGLAFALMLPAAVASADPLVEDEALFAEALCPQAILDLTAEGPRQMGVMLYSPCHAGQTVVIDHAGLVLATQVSSIGDVYASMSVVDPAQPVTMTFENGMMAEAMPPVTEQIDNLQHVSARW